MGNKFLTKSEILSRKPILKEVEVPQWGGSVHIRPMTVAEQTQLAELGTKYDKGKTIDRIMNITLKVIKWTVVDDEGNQMFTDDDLEQLMQSDASAIMTLQDAIIGYSGLTSESREELAKNLKSQADEANL